jgi:hypothetical protein
MPRIWNLCPKGVYPRDSYAVSSSLCSWSISLCLLHQAATSSLLTFLTPLLLHTYQRLFTANKPYHPSSSLQHSCSLYLSSWILWPYYSFKTTKSRKPDNNVIKELAKRRTVEVNLIYPFSPLQVGCYFQYILGIRKPFYCNLFLPAVIWIVSFMKPLLMHKYLFLISLKRKRL